MKYRNIVKNDDGTYNIVWFGSCGLNQDGTKKPADNYVTGQEGVAKSLTQWLAVIKGELWYSINYGFPLTDKIRNKATYDAYTIQLISSHPEVDRITKYSSVVKNGVYTFSCTILSIFGEEFSISSEANI